MLVSSIEALTIVFLGEVGVTPLLEGIGFYETIEKTSVNGASLAGGTEIVIYGQGMSHTPSTISAIFTNKNLGTG
jgi:fatty acid/phospholipid biosynthesis enzyme